VIDKPLTLFLTALIFLTACGMDMATENLNLTADYPTATLAISLSPLPIESMTASSSTPSNLRVEGVTTTQINVRSEPSTAGTHLGTIPPFSTVQILGKESYSVWYQIEYSNSPNGKGWITAAYVQVTTDHVIPLIETGTGSGVNGLVIQAVNVRSGPGTTFESLGTLIPNDVVVVTAKDTSGAWMQIEFKSRVGWVASEFMRLDNKDALPVVPETPQAAIATPQVVIEAPGFVPALPDGDSMQAPSAAVNLSLSGTRAFEFSGDISSPAGDGEDWVQFSSVSKMIRMDFFCSSNNAQLDLWKNGGIVDTLHCNQSRSVEITPAEILSTQIHRMDSSSSMFVTYRLKVEILP
jgi:uncharacterized protein YraI